jgi:hypothetical protein
MTEEIELFEPASKPALVELVDTPELIEVGRPFAVEFFDVVGAVSAPVGATVFIQGETPTGLVNGVNTNFTTTNDFSTIRVFLNGLGLIVNLDYIITGINTFHMQQPPVTGDILTVDYTI